LTINNTYNIVYIENYESINEKIQIKEPKKSFYLKMKER